MFTWKILEVSAKDGVITHARYHVTASSEDKSVETEGNWYFDCATAKAVSYTHLTLPTKRIV